MEGEGVAERAEGAGATVASVDVGSVDVGAADRVGIVSGGGGASLEGAPSLTEGEALPSLPLVTVSAENDGAAISQVEEAPLSPVRRIDLDRIDASKTPTDQQIFDLSQILQINKKNGVTSSTVDFLLPPTKQHHRVPPPHVVAWDGFTWRDVILALYIWNRVMTLEERQHELKKSSNLRTKNASRYRKLLKNVKQLHNNRPSALADIAVPTTNNSGDDDDVDVAPSLLRRSTRAMDNERAQQMDQLVVRARELANDPELQERARQIAAAGTQRRRAPARAPAPAAAPVQIVGLGSADADRMEVVQHRQARRKRWKKRKRGDNCTSIGMQSDAQATSTVNAFHKTAGETAETLYYSHLKDGEPTHAIMAVSYNDLDTYNPDGGRSRSTGRRSKKPSLTITAESRGSAIKMLQQAARALAGTRDAAVSPDGVYELENVNLYCNFKDASTDTPLHDTIQQRHERFKKDNLSRPAIHHETMEQIQLRMPDEIAAGADMSPGVRDRRMADARRDE